MIYALRVVLADRPGSLGALATALGTVGADIVSLEIVDRGPDGAVDDLVVELPPGGLADTLLTAAASVPGARVESLRPHFGAQQFYRDLDLLDEIATYPQEAVELLVERLPLVLRCGFALLVSDAGVQQRSSAAPPDELAVPWLPLPAARRFDFDPAWMPPRFDDRAVEVAATPFDGARAVLVGRPGGPRFRAGELLRLQHLAAIAASVALSPAPVG